MTFNQPIDVHADLSVEEKKHLAQQSSKVADRIGTTLACIMTFLFFYQPGIDRQALFTWFRSLFKNDLHFYVIGINAIHLFVFGGANLMMYLIYHLNWHIFEQYRIRPTWPWERSEQDRVAWRSLVIKSILLVVFNQITLGTPMAYLAFDDLDPATFDPAAVPEWYVSMFQIGCFMVIEDFLFYHLHRVLHIKSIYPYIHKLHHNYFESVSIAAEYSHPIDYLLASLIPVSAGPLLFKAHFYTLGMWLSLRLAETVDGHCGYEFPFTPYRLLPFSGSASAHDWHHSRNVGNYSSFFCIWDRLYGTDTDFLKYEEEKHKLKAAKTD